MQAEWYQRDITIVANRKSISNLWHCVHNGGKLVVFSSDSSERYQ